MKSERERNKLKLRCPCQVGSARVKFRRQQDKLPTTVHKGRFSRLPPESESRFIQPAKHIPWGNRQTTDHRRGHVFLPMRLACASVYFRIGGARRELFRPTCLAPTMRPLQHLRSIPHAGDRERRRLREVVGLSGLPLHG